MYFVYILQSVVDPLKLYIGQTNDISDRLKRHNAGQVFSTNSLKPWKLAWSTPKSSRSDALKLEKYLKTLSRERKLACFDNYKNQGIS